MPIFLCIVQIMQWYGNETHVIGVYEPNYHPATGVKPALDSSYQSTTSMQYTVWFAGW